MVLEVPALKKKKMYWNVTELDYTSIKKTGFMKFKNQQALQTNRSLHEQDKCDLTVLFNSINWILLHIITRIFFSCSEDYSVCVLAKKHLPSQSEIGKDMLRSGFGGFPSFLFLT